MRLGTAMFLVEEELTRATHKFGPFHSAHEAYGVLLEEVDELWEAVRMKQSDTKRRPRAIREEAIQVAAMALRILVDLCPSKGALK
jgi:hypothetical protein